MTDLETRIRKIIANTPGCCRENALMHLASTLKAQGRKAEAAELGKIVEKLLKRNPRVAGKPSKHLQGAPQEVDRYYESCLKKYGKRSDAKEHCESVARRILCSHVLPNHAWCR